MIKALLWFLLSAVTATFLASAMLQYSRAHYEAEERRNGMPSEFFVEIVEPKLRAARVEIDCASTPPLAGPATQPATQPSG